MRDRPPGDKGIIEAQDFRAEPHITMRQVIIGGALSVSAIVCLLVAPCFWSMEGHGASLSQYRQLEKGLTQAEVKRLLGEPSAIYPFDDGSQEWAYTRMTWCIIYLDFAPDGRLEEFWHDH